MTLLSANKNYCKNHPESETTWRCVECGREFCDNCIKPVEHYYVRTAVCPECKGRCEDFIFKAEQAREKEKEEFNKKRNTIFQYIAFSLISIVFLFSPNDLTFLFLVIASFWFSPIKNIDLIYKLGAFLFFCCINNPLLSSFAAGAWMMIFKDLPGVFLSYKKYLIQSALITLVFYMNEKISNWVSTIYYSKRQITPEKFGVHRWIIISLSLMVIALIIIFGVVKLIPEPKEDEVTQIKKLTQRIAEEMAKEDIDRAKVMKLEGALDEKLNKLNPQVKGNETEEMLNSLLEPYRTLTLNEVWQHYEKGREKFGDDMVWVRHLKTNIFDRDFRNYKTVAEVIEKGTPFSKYYLYIHLNYVPMPES